MSRAKIRAEAIRLALDGLSHECRHTGPWNDELNACGDCYRLAVAAVDALGDRVTAGPKRRRSRTSAKGAGTAFETLIARGLAAALDDDRIERRVRNGRKDRGDISGLLAHGGGRIVVECKDYGGQINAAAWAREAETERGNDDALAGLVVAKRMGTAKFGDQWVVMTMRDFVAIRTGRRDHTI
ncbi:hypothetical protein [Nocardia niigatensis]